MVQIILYGCVVDIKRGSFEYLSHNALKAQ